MTCTKIKSCCTLRTSFDIAFNAVSDYGCNPERSLNEYMFSQICSYLWPHEVPRHDFDCIRHDIYDQVDGIPPRACRPPTNKFKHL